MVTGDFDFSDIRNYPPDEYEGVVVVVLPRNATTHSINGLIEDLLQQHDLLSLLPGRLAIVEPGRVRLRAGL